MVAVRTQYTPNPNAKKFILDKDVIAEGKISYDDPLACMHVPLAREILKLAGVTQVHFFENVITVTQDGSEDWEILDAKLQAVMEEFGVNHDPFFVKEVALPKRQLTGALKDIDAILDDTIRPSLQADGGDIEVIEYQDNILTVHFEGACGTCPSSTQGTLYAIRGVLREQFNPDIEVALV